MLKSVAKAAEAAGLSPSEVVAMALAASSTWRTQQSAKVEVRQ